MLLLKKLNHFLFDYILGQDLVEEIQAHQHPRLQEVPHNLFNLHFQVHLLTVEVVE